MINIRYLFPAILLFSLLCSCTRYPSDLREDGEWKHLEEFEGNDWYFRAENHIYGLQLYPDRTKYYWAIDPLQNVDVETFMVCSGSDYAKDKRYVYYPIALEAFDGDLIGGYQMWKYIVKGADPKTFKYIGDGYGVDWLNMYFEGIKIPWNSDILDREKRKKIIESRNMKLVDFPPSEQAADTIPAENEN